MNDRRSQPAASVEKPALMTTRRSQQSALDELRREVEALRADRDRLEWVRDMFFTHRWNAVIGPGYRTTWHVVPHYRHIHLSDSSGNATGDFRAAIDTARASTDEGMGK
jgi:hypothetical protein